MGYLTDEHAVHELREALRAAVQDLEILGEVFRLLGEEYGQRAALDHVPLYKSIIEQYAP